MAKNEKTQAQALSAAELKEAVRKCDRPAVLEAIEAKSFDNIGAEQFDELGRSIMGLRDHKIAAELTKAIPVTPAMLTLDFDNRNNKQFVNEYLDKHAKKLEITDSNIEAYFDIACAVGNVRLVDLVLKKDASADRYVRLAGGSNEVFELLLDLDLKHLDADTVANLTVAAAMTASGRDRVEDLVNAGLPVAEKNSAGKTACDLLGDAIAAYAYPKNKKGELLKRTNVSAQTYLRNFDPVKGAGEKEEKQKNAFFYAFLGIMAVFLIIIAGFAMNIEPAATTETVDATTDDTTATTEEDDSTYLSQSEDIEVAMGNTVNIDFTGYINGEAFDGGSGESYDLQIGSGSFIDDFEEQLIGAKVGDVVEVNVTFPEDYQASELAGVDATFEVTINGIYADQTTGEPVVDESLVVGSDYETDTTEE